MGAVVGAAMFLIALASLEIIVAILEKLGDK